VTGLVGIGRDITERKHAEDEIHRLNVELEQRVRQRTEQLELANHELEAFVYSVSHDLRAPLRAMNGFSQVLAEDYGSILDETAHDYIKRIQAASLRMSQLIEDLLQLSQVTRSEIRIAQVDLAELAREIAADLQATQPERNVTWVTAPSMVVKADAAMLRIALNNLLGNAWKFTSKTSLPRIEFGAKNENGSMLYYVNDNGAGFDMAYAGKLFGAFQRLHTDRDFEGTGIGLALVQRIIHRHGGKVWGEGIVGKGATFYFTLDQE